MRRLKPSTIYILKGLVPYTAPNMKLTFKPNLFFNELEKMGKGSAGVKAAAFRQEYYRAQRKGLFKIDKNGRPELTKFGKHQLKIFEPEKLSGALLLVTFDIEERQRAKRREFRTLLRILRFTQVQKSVWISEYDSRSILKDEIRKLNLAHEVAIFEARNI